MKPKRIAKPKQLKLLTMQDTYERTSIMAKLGHLKYVENNDIELNFKELKIYFKCTFER